MKCAFVVASALLSAAVCTLPERTALADSDSASQARSLFTEALSLVAKAKTTGDARTYGDAIAKFLAAYRLSERPNALFNAAMTEQKILRYAEAMHHFRVLLHNPACDAATKEQIGKAMADLTPNVATILLDAPAGAAIAIDGLDTGEKAPLADPIDLIPGKHTIEARTTLSASVVIDALAGTQQTVRVGFADVGSAPVVAPLPAAPPPSAFGPEQAAAGPHFWNTRRVLGVGAASLGVASFVLSGVFQGQSTSEKNKAASIGATLGPSACIPPNLASQCSDLRSAYAAQNTDEDVSRVFLGVGIGAVALGAALFFWPQPSPTTHTALVPIPFEHGAGLGVAGDL